MFLIPRMLFRDFASMATENSPSETAGASRTRRLVLVAVVAVLVVAGLIALVVTGAPSATTSTTSTSISASPSAILFSAVQTNPSGFVLESSKPEAPVNGAQGGGWAVLGQSDGSVANITVVVYASTNASQAYFERLVANVKDLTGYTDVTSDLTAFQQYGKCYGYGEDVDGIAVANGVCTKGNVFLQVHLVSGVPFSTLESDLTSLMGALYQSAL